MSSLQFKVLRRGKCSFTELKDLLVDPRMKQMVFVLSKLEGKMRYITDLLDPNIEPVQYTPSLLAIAGANKNWILRNNNSLITALSEITVLIEEIMVVGYNTNPAIEEATSTTENLGTIFRQVINVIAEITGLISKLETSTFADDILLHVADIRKTWLDLKLLLTNQMTEVWRHILREEARTALLKQFGEALYPSQIRS